MIKFLKGMVKDPERVDQPENSYRDALNANLYLLKGAIVNEQGTKLVNTQYPIENIIGQCALTDGRILIFGIDSNSHMISLVSPKESSYTVLYRNNALNFQPDYTIEATAKVDTQGDTLVYFTDNYIVRNTDPGTGIRYIDDFNPPRAFNVSLQLRSLSAGNTVLYGNPEYNVDKLDLFMHAGTIPQFAEVNIEEGGGVVSGTYHLALAYGDDNGNRTNYLITSNAVHLVTAHEDAIPTESITGDPQGSQSKKSITWDVIIPSQVNYSHVTPVIIQRFGGQNQESSEFAYQLQDVKIPNYTGGDRSLKITYTGLENVAAGSISEVVIDSVRYETAKTLVQLDNRLYISNLEARGDLGYQRFANNIKLDAVKEKIERFDPRYFDIISLNTGYSFFKRPATSLEYEIDPRFNIYKEEQLRTSTADPVQQGKFASAVRKGYKDSKLFYKKKSFRRSEVYAFYISFVLKDGTETYAYHIPGREAERISGTTNERTPIVNFPNSVITAEVLDTTEFKNLYNDSKLFQIADTHILLSDLAGITKTTSYWENANEFYPSNEDFDVWTTNLSGETEYVSSIKNQNVRHHKMPSNKSTNWKFIGDASNSVNNFSPAIGTASDNQLQPFKMFEDINILGIKLSNICIPKFILKQIQGYKIYYAKRNQENKTIIGQSVPVPAAFTGITSLTMDLQLAPRGPFQKAWYMYGGIPNEVDQYPRVIKGTHRYRGISVFGFHDFNLLKNKHTLSGASHIDVQSILVMRQYKGGPNVKENLISNVKEFYFPKWLSTEIGNTFDPDQEDSNEGVSNALRIKAFNTSVLLASAYLEPKDIINPNVNMSLTNRGGLNNTNSFYVIKPESVTYLPGHIFLKNDSGVAFHGATYLYNFGGETEIAIGLETGLPALYSWNLDGIAVIGTRLPWYSPNAYLNPTAGEEYNYDYVLRAGRPNVLDYDGVKIGGWPMTYLINLCAIKSDLYKGFDEQKLVWTGYYKDLSDVNSNTGRDSKNANNYFLGGESDNIFGGDTYIGRYSVRSTSLGYGWSRYPYHDVPFVGEQVGGIDVVPGGLTPTTTSNSTILNLVEDITGLTPEDIVDGLDFFNENTYAGQVWAIPESWKRGNNTPIATIFYFMCESDDLLGYRHSGDQSQGVSTEDSLFFDYSTASASLFGGPLSDYTKMDNLLYMNNYSLNQDLKVAIPFPKNLNNIITFPNRSIRSLDDEGSINDKYRIYQALEFKDIPKNRGQINKLFAMGSILYIHTERSMFVTKGDQEIQLSDQSQAYVGSGNIFAQNPDELISTNEGYGGTDSQFTGLTTRYGHFFVNRRDKKVYLFAENIAELSALGMERWFLDNIPYQLELLGIDLTLSGFKVDSPTSHFGFVSTYDPKYKRIILTKRELIPTSSFNSLFAQGVIELIGNQFYDNRSESFLSLTDTRYFRKGGWTLSFYPEIQAWGSRHSYIPRLYTNTAEEFYSLINESDSTAGQIWEHSDINSPCNFYDVVHKFEFEFISNEAPGSPKVFSNIYYWADTVSISPINYKETFKQTSTGFTDFYVYNTTQISGNLTRINYLSNTRRVDKLWYINDFRDMSKTALLTTDELVTGIPNVQGDLTQGVTSNLNNVTMFLEEGVVNNNYINTNKSWFEQKRFVDHYLGVRLISDNSTNNLIYLYAAGTKHRQSYR